MKKRLFHDRLAGEDLHGACHAMDGKFTSSSRDLFRDAIRL